MIPSCSDPDSDDPGNDEEGLRMCCELGAWCHRVPPDPDLAECHNIGHLNDPQGCRDNYERCMSLCAPSGEGGAGGAFEPSEHACE